MKEVIERLQKLADRADKYNYPEDSNMGVRISDIRAVLGLYEHHKGESETPNAPDITPEWDKIPEGFIFVSIDKNGEEHAYSKEPFPDDRQWRGGWHWNKTGRKLNMKGIDWTKTLSKRPAK